MIKQRMAAVLPQPDDQRFCSGMQFKSGEIWSCTYVFLCLPAHGCGDGFLVDVLCLNTVERA